MQTSKHASNGDDRGIQTGTSNFDRQQFVVSSRCGGGDCVAVAQLPDGSVAVRDNKDLSQPPMVFTRAEWQAFVAGVKDGEFDVEE